MRAGVLALNGSRLHALGQGGRSFRGLRLQLRAVPSLRGDGRHARGLYPRAHLRHDGGRALRRQVHLFLPEGADVLRLPDSERGRSAGQDHRRPVHHGGAAGFYRLRAHRKRPPDGRDARARNRRRGGGSPRSAGARQPALNAALYGRGLSQQRIGGKPPAAKPPFGRDSGPDHGLYSDAQAGRQHARLSL